MNKRKYLLDVYKENNLVLKQHELNLIKAPCGSGKTTFFFEYLCKKYDTKRILYLVDTTMLKDSMVSEYDILDYYDRLNMFKNKISVTSYHKFGLMLINNHDILNHYDLIVMDESHNVIKYSKIGCEDIKRIADENATMYNVEMGSSMVHGCSYLKNNLPKIIKEYKTIFLLMTATPDSIINYTPWKLNLYDVLQGIELQGYINKITLDYKDSFKNALKLLQDHHHEGDKVLIYSKRINNCKIIKEHIQELGYTVETLHSINNNSEPMTEDQLALRKYIIQNNRYPDDLDVLIINGAYETGWNLKDERVQIVITNTNEKDVSIQARGRCRHDIKLLIQKSNNTNANALLNIIEEYKNIKIFTKEQKTEILEELKMYNSRGKLVGWTTFKKEVEKTNKYTVRTGHTHIDGKKVRYDIIEEKKD